MGVNPNEEVPTGVGLDLAQRITVCQGRGDIHQINEDSM